MAGAWFPADLFSAVKSVTIAMLPAVESVLAMAPALGGGLSVAIWRPTTVLNSLRREPARALT